MTSKKNKIDFTKNICIFRRHSKVDSRKSFYVSEKGSNKNVKYRMLFGLFAINKINTSINYFTLIQSCAHDKQKLVIHDTKENVENI